MVKVTGPLNLGDRQGLATKNSMVPMVLMALEIGKRKGSFLGDSSLARD